MELLREALSNQLGLLSEPLDSVIVNNGLDVRQITLKSLLYQMYFLGQQLIDLFLAVPYARGLTSALIDIHKVLIWENGVHYRQQK